MKSFKYFLPLCFLLINCSQGNKASQDNSGGSSSDPFMAYAWHLQNTGQSVFASNAGTSGNDLNLQATWGEGNLGAGIHIRVSDDGIEDTHPDLTANFAGTGMSRNYALSSPYTADSARPIDETDNHGTSVSGLIAAAKNTIGSRGVAPEATISSANFLSSGVTQTLAKMIDQASGSFDVLNMSWGLGQSMLYSEEPTYWAQLETAVTTGRSGKGSILVKSAGNDFVTLCNGSTTVWCIGNANFDIENNNPYLMAVAALSASEASSSYSSTGSNVWISGFGGESGDDDPAMMTTDRAGCALGYAKSTAASTVGFEKGNNGNSGCNYTVTFNGTSSAAPTVSGSVALLLAANSALTWRDVKFILASTAAKIDYTTTGGVTSHPLSGYYSGYDLPATYVWEQPWVVNNAGFSFHNWYGFGRIDVDAAVAMAKTYTSTLGTYQETEWDASHEHTGLSVAIPDFSATGGSDTINVATNIKIEAVQIKAWVTHADISELAIELTSPSGKKSIVVNARNSLTGIANLSGEIFLTNAFYQESTSGNWTMKVVDAKTGNTGTLTRWALNFVGAP